MLSPSLRCQARRPQSKKVRLACVLPSGLDVEHKCMYFLNTKRGAASGRYPTYVTCNLQGLQCEGSDVACYHVSN